jgi:hypothetical protein
MMNLTGNFILLLVDGDLRLSDPAGKCNSLFGKLQPFFADDFFLLSLTLSLMALTPDNVEATALDIAAIRHTSGSLQHKEINVWSSHRNPGGCHFTHHGHFSLTSVTDRTLPGGPEIQAQ